MDNLTDSRMQKWEKEICMTVQLSEAITSNKYPLNLDKSVGCLHARSSWTVNIFYQ